MRERNAPFAQIPSIFDHHRRSSIIVLLQPENGLFLPHPIRFRGLRIVRDQTCLTVFQVIDSYFGMLGMRFKRVDRDGIYGECSIGTRDGRTTAWGTE